MVENHKIRYSRVHRNGDRHFEPTAKMRLFGFEWRNLGAEGPAARAKAWGLYEEWLAARKGPAPATGDARPVYTLGSVGWAWERYRRTDAWKSKAKSTRDKDWDWSWQWIKPAFADLDPATIEIEMLEELRTTVLETKGLHTAHRVIKTWRAFWQVMAAMKLCDKDADPSMIIRNRAPKGRKETWSEAEIIRIAKAAWRAGYQGLAALLAVAWDTQFAPVDCRLLTPGQRLKDARGDFFDTSRGKTGKAVLGTLSRRSVRVLDGYIAGLGFELHEDAAIFRNRSGAVYSADTLGDDFRVVREMAFPKDSRKLLDIRRSGAVEALAGEVDPGAMAAKMGNTIDKNRQLQETYLPKRAATVRLADEARKRGRKVLKENG